MKKMKVVMPVILLALIMLTSNAGAITNITIFDGSWDPDHGDPWYVGEGVGYENNDVEPYATTGQRWDLEAVVVNGADLILVGGWNFRGISQPWSGTNFQSGDLFLALGNQPAYGPDATTVTQSAVDPINPLIVHSNFGYNYALDIHWGDPTATTFDYDIYGLAGASVEVANVYGGDPPPGMHTDANPYRYLDGGEYIASGSLTWAHIPYGWAANNLGLTYLESTDFHRYMITFENLLHEDGFLGDQWSVLGLDEGQTTTLWTHFTQECGNDNLMGRMENFKPVPEPFSMLMLGCLGTGMLGSRKIRKWRKAAR